MYITIVHYVNAGIAYIFNGFLAYLILYKTKMEMGRYKYLLMVFTIFNVVHPTVYIVAAPIIISAGHSSFSLPTGIFAHNPVAGSITMIMFSSFYCQSLLLLFYHFAYRFIVICKSKHVFVLESSITLIVAVVFYIIIVLIWCLTTMLVFEPNESERQIAVLAVNRKFGEGTVPYDVAAIGGTFWIANDDGSYKPSHRAFLGVCILSGVMGFLFNSIFYFSFQIMRSLARKTISRRALKVQNDMFRSLLVQALVPLILDYTPCTVSFLVPIFGLPIDTTTMSIFFSLYPVIEPLAIAYFVRDYRESIMNIFGKSKYSENQETTIGSRSRRSNAVAIVNSVKASSKVTVE